METNDIWTKTLNAAIQLPFVGVDRKEFLRKELSPYCTPEQIQTALDDSPVKVITQKQLNKICKGCIDYHTTLVCAASAVAGIPGGAGMFVAIPADMAQFYGHVLALIQKLMYLYGWPDFKESDGKLTDETANILTLFVGIMFGSKEATIMLNKLLQEFSKQAAKRIPKIALTKYGFYVVAKQVGKWIGVTITKDSFAKGVSKIIPLIGAPVSAAVTYWTFRPMCQKLKAFLNEQKMLTSQLY